MSWSLTSDRLNWQSVCGCLDNLVVLLSCRVSVDVWTLLESLFLIHSTGRLSGDVWTLLKSLFLVHGTGRLSGDVWTLF